MLKKFLNKDSSSSTDGLTPEERKLKEDEEKRLQEDKEIEKDERRLKVVMDSIRKLYAEYHLTGSFDVYKSFGAFTQSLSLEITTEEEEAATTDDTETDSVLAEEVEQKTNFQKIVIAAARKGIVTLMRRSRAYKKQQYRKDLTLSTSISVSDPFLGIMSTSISLSASAESLIAAEALYQAQKSSGEK